ncbi:hypothetical protein B0H13DRAFT_2079356, partial [Mycena leptocephala]
NYHDSETVLTRNSVESSRNAFLAASSSLLLLVLILEAQAGGFRCVQEICCFSVLRKPKLKRHNCELSLCLEIFSLISRSSWRYCLAVASANLEWSTVFRGEAGGTVYVTEQVNQIPTTHFAFAAFHPSNSSASCQPLRVQAIPTHLCRDPEQQDSAILLPRPAEGIQRK